MFKHVLVTAGATLAMAGMAATTAQAGYDLTGGNYTSTSFASEFSMDAGTRVLCSATTLSGNTDNVMGETASTAVTPTFSSCGVRASLPLVARVSQPWKLTVTGTGVAGTFDAVVGTSDRKLVEFVHPVAVSNPALEPFVCKITFKTPVGGAQVRLSQGGSGAYLDLGGANLAYESNGYCGTPGSGSGPLSTSGTILLSGVGISEL